MVQQLRGGGALKFARLKQRAYDDGRLRTHAKYGVIHRGAVVARIIRNGRKWIALQISEDNDFGKPVSPMNYVLLRDVKEWALQRFSR